MKKILIFLFIHFCFISASSAQGIKAGNIQWNVENEQVLITYDLPSNKALKNISIVLKRNSNQTFGIVPKTMKGDFGKGEFSGPGKKVQWDYLKDVPAGLDGDDYYFVIAVELLEEKPRSIAEVETKPKPVQTEEKKPEQKQKESMENVSKPGRVSFRTGVLADYYSVGDNYAGLEGVGSGGAFVNVLFKVAGLKLGTGFSIVSGYGEFAYLSGIGEKWYGNYYESTFRPQVFVTNKGKEGRSFYPFYKAGLAAAISGGSLDYGNDGKNYTGSSAAFEIPLGGGVSLINKKIGLLSGIDLNLSPFGGQRTINIPEENSDVTVGKRLYSISFYVGISF